MQEEEEPPSLSELQHHTALLADPGTGQEGVVASLQALLRLEVNTVYRILDMLQCNENQHTSHHFLPQLLYTHYNLQVTYSALNESWDGPLLDLVRELSDAQGEVKITSCTHFTHCG